MFYIIYVELCTANLYGKKETQCNNIITGQHIRKMKKKKNENKNNNNNTVY